MNEREARMKEGGGGEAWAARREAEGEQGPTQLSIKCTRVLWKGKGVKEKSLAG